MRFSACNTGNNLHCSYSIDCKVLDFITFHGDLGVLVDSLLQFHDHIRNIVRKAGDYQVNCYTLSFVILQFLWLLYLCQL